MANWTHRIFLITVLGLLMAATSHAAAVGAPAPDFTLKSLSGENIRLKEQRGQLVLLGFWGSWCSNCPAALQRLQRYADQYQSQGFAVFAIGLDRDEQKLRHLARDAGVTYPVLFDPYGHIGERYDVASLPTWLLVDRDGKVLAEFRRFGDADLIPLDNLLKQRVMP